MAKAILTKRAGSAACEGRCECAVVELIPCPKACSAWRATSQEVGHPHTPRDAGRRRPHRAGRPTPLGIAVGQVAKSIIFRRKSDDAAVLVVTSGDRRVDEKKVDAHVSARSAAPMPIS